jgi:hypothetical protein
VKKRLAVWVKAQLSQVWADLDLYALLLVGLIFSVLGVIGVSDTKTLSSVVLALLTLLAFSQIRARHSAHEAGSKGVVFYGDFPEDVYKHRDSVRSDWLYIGTSGYRTIGAGRLQIVRMLQRNVRVRILLLDFEREGLLESLALRDSRGSSPSRLRERIEASLAEIQEIQQEGHPGKLEVKLLSFVTTVGVNAFDAHRPDGEIFVQHYEHGASAEASPIYGLSVDDGYWYQHQWAEFERMWSSGRSI